MTVDPRVRHIGVLGMDVGAAWRDENQRFGFIRSIRVGSATSRAITCGLVDIVPANCTWRHGTEVAPVVSWPATLSSCPRSKVLIRDNARLSEIREMPTRAGATPDPATAGRPATVLSGIFRDLPGSIPVSEDSCTFLSVFTKSCNISASAFSERWSRARAPSRTEPPGHEASVAPAWRSGSPARAIPHPVRRPLARRRPTARSSRLLRPPGSSGHGARDH